MTPEQFEKCWPGCRPFWLDNYWYVKVLVPPHLAIVGGAVSIDHLSDMLTDFWERKEEEPWN